MNLGSKRALIWDLGIFPEAAVRLARDCASVDYFVPDYASFPEPYKALIGKGLEGVNRVDKWLINMDKYDFTFIPDTYCQDITEGLKKLGYPVCGSGFSEDLETDREYGRETQYGDGNNLPSPPTFIIKGISALTQFCKEHKDFHIKLDGIRGLEETFHHEDWAHSEDTIYKMAYKMGPFKEDIKFLCEGSVPGIETGYDGVTFDDELLYPVTIGYEEKGIGYIAKIVNENEMPVALKLVHDGLSHIFKKNKTRMFYSTEVRIPEEGKDKGYPFLIDPSIRLAAPGVSSIQYEAIENYSEVVYGLATGEKVSPIMKCKYAAALAFDSSEAGKTFVAMTFPKELRKWIKLRMAARKDGIYQAIPGFESLGCVIALGDSVEEVVKTVNERAKEIKAKRIDYEGNKLDDIIKSIKKGEKVGIPF